MVSPVHVLMLSIKLCVIFLACVHLTLFLAYLPVCAVKSVQYLGELLNGLLGAAVTPVDDVDAVRHRISDVLLHETAEPAQVGADARDSHHRTFR